MVFGSGKSRAMFEFKECQKKESSVQEMSSLGASDVTS